MIFQVKLKMHHLTCLHFDYCDEFYLKHVHMDCVIQLRRKPLLLTRTLRIIKYWFKVLRSKNCLMKSIYDYDLKNMLSSWIIFVKNTLMSNGFGDVWYYPESVNEKMFYVYFEQRLSDCFYQNLRVEIENAHPLRLYKYLNLNCLYTRQSI